MSSFTPPGSDGHTQRQLDAFAAFAREEEEFFRWQAEKIALIEKELRKLGASGVLGDIGCFTGMATERFFALGFEKAVGFDITQEVLARAAVRGIEGRLWKAGTESCPAQDAEFDCVIAADVIEHIVNTDQFMAEIRRILKPGGRLIVTTPNLSFWISRLRLLRGKPPWSYPGPSPTVRADQMVDLNHIRITTRAEWEALFRAAGFHIERVLGWSILHAMGSSLGVRLRRLIDRWMTRTPERAFGLLFVMAKVV